MTVSAQTHVTAAPAAPASTNVATTGGTPIEAVAAPTGRRYVQLVLVLGALIAIGPLTIDMYLPALPALASDLGASDSAVQATLTGMLLGLGVGQLIIGPLSDAFGRRRPLLMGLVAHGLTSVLCAVSPDILTLTAARTLQGFAGAAVSVVAMAIVRDLFTGIAAARMLSRLMLVMGVAPILAPTLGGQVLQFTSWRGIFVVLGSAAAILIVVAAVGLRETLPRERRRSALPMATLRTYRGLLRDRVFVALALIAGLVFATLFAYIAGSPFVLQGVYGLDEQSFALVFGLNALGLIAASQLNPVLLRHRTPAAVLTGAVLIATLASLVLIATAATGLGGLLGVLLPLGVIVAMCGLAFPNTPALALSRHGEAAGTAAAMLGAAQFGIGGLGAPLVGALGTASALPMATIMAATLLAATALMLLVVRRSEAR